MDLKKLKWNGMDLDQDMTWVKFQHCKKLGLKWNWNNLGRIWNDIVYGIGKDLRCDLERF